MLIINLFRHKRIRPTVTIHKSHYIDKPKAIYMYSIRVYVFLFL